MSFSDADPTKSVTSNFPYATIVSTMDASQWWLRLLHLKGGDIEIFLVFRVMGTSTLRLGHTD
jgi:hypothetical protein